MFTIQNPLDVLYFVLAVAAVWIGVMLTWLLFEAALMAHRANKVAKDVLDKAARFERAVVNIKERLESSAGYLGVLAEGGKALVGYLSEKGTKKSRRRKKDDEDEEDDD
jgi:mannitol-1-phosphate/altronate dehydrogenase